VCVVCACCVIDVVGAVDVGVGCYNDVADNAVAVGVGCVAIVVIILYNVMIFVNTHEYMVAELCAGNTYIYTRIPPQ